jgi:hypothetical protein
VPDQSDPIKKDDAPAKPLTAAQKLKAKRKRAKELRMMHKLGIPTPKKGGKRAGAGQRPFSPTDDQRRIVLMMKGMKQSEEVIANAIMNPHTQWPITVETLHKHFRKELDTGVAAVIAILSGTLMKNLARGLEGTSFFMSKNLMGFRSEPLDPRPVLGKGDEYVPNADGSPGGPTITRRIIIEGGLPKGSTPEKPEGDDYDEVPPEEPRK